MIYASTAEQEEWASGGAKQLVLTFSDGRVITNEDIVSESMSLEQTICDETQLTFGGASSACFKVDVFATAGKFKGLTFDATISTGDYTRKLGTFKVASDKLSDERDYRELECYDALKDVLSTDYSEWNNGLKFPTTIKAYRDAFFSHIGITQADADLVNDGISAAGFTADNLSGTDILKAICEANACFGFLDQDGVFQYIQLVSREGTLYPALDLYPSTTLYPRDWVGVRLGGGNEQRGSYYQGGLRYEEYECQKITRVQVRTTNKDIGAVAGEPGNDYIVENNVLLNGSSAEQLSTAATNILRSIQFITYTPSSVQTYGMPWIQPGDVVGITAPNGDDVICYILHRTMSGINALQDVYECKGAEYRSDKANGTNKNIIQLSRKTNELERTAEQTQSTITEMQGTQTSMQSQITQNATNISAEVTNRQTADQTIIQQSATAISLSVKNNESNTTAGITISLTNSKGEKVGSDATGTINLSGLVTFTNLTDGTTKISGGNILTGTVSASRIDVDNLYAKHLSGATGSIGDLTASGTITCTGTISGGKIEQKVVGSEGGGYGADPNGSYAVLWDGILGIGHIKFNGGAKLRPSGEDDDGVLGVNCSGHFSVNGNIYTNKRGRAKGNALIRGSVICSDYCDGSGDTLSIGGTTFSDINLKKDVTDIDAEAASKFILGLRPVSYRKKTVKRVWRDDGYDHHGFIAQEVEAKEYGNWRLVSQQVAHPEYKTLNYIELIPDMIKVIQDQEKRIAALEAKNAESV